MHIIRILILITSFMFVGWAVEIAPTLTPSIITDMNVSAIANADIPQTIFGTTLFNGSFSQNRQYRYNPNYLINIGDTVNVKLWGAFDYEAALSVDTQGNIFIPKVGIVSLRGIRNDELRKKVDDAVKNLYKSNVYVYADLQNYQPVSVYVTGSVKKPGLYEGLSSDSIVQYLDKANGIDPNNGSYRTIHILRHNQTIKTIDLYNFLLYGKLDLFQFEIGDVIVVESVGAYVSVSGDVKRPCRFELLTPEISVGELAQIAVINLTATNVVITHWNGHNEKITSIHSLTQDGAMIVKSGDSVEFIPDHNSKTVDISIEGEHGNLHSIVIPKGTTLKDVLAQIVYTPLSDREAIQIFRQSVADKQKQLLDAELRDLEASALTTGSATSEEAIIRHQEAQLILDFVQRAKSVIPKGQVVINPNSDLSQIAMEEGDTVYIPRKNRTIVVQGEVMLPGAQTYVDSLSFDNYVAYSGGFNFRANRENVLIIHQNGRAESYNASLAFGVAPQVQPGDAIMVLSKVDSKNLQIVKDISQILYQIAVGAAVVLRAF